MTKPPSEIPLFFGASIPIPIETWSTADSVHLSNTEKVFSGITVELNLSRMDVMVPCAAPLDKNGDAFPWKKWGCHG